MGKRIARSEREDAQPLDEGRPGLCNRHGWRRYLIAVLATLFLSLGLSHAASYVYDSNGRVIAVTRADGTSASYVYDSVGNLKQIVSTPAGQLAIFGFDPNHGSPGQPVTVFGKGFSAVPASDAVSFNGAAATVASASSTLLNVSVPVGATTGPISISVGAKSATSSESFVVDATGQPPVITSFSPSVAAAGTPIALIGQHLDPIPQQTYVTQNGEAAAISSAADTLINFDVPTLAGSGHVSVETPYGLATSTADLVVAPPGVNPTAIVATQRIIVGGSQNLNISAAGDYGVLLFDYVQGSFLSFQINSLATTANNVNYSVYDKRNRIVLSGKISKASPTIHLPQLGTSGTYSIYFQPDTSSATLAVSLEAAPLLVANAPASALTTTVANQSKRYLFSATQGQTLALVIPSATTTPSGGSLAITIIGPTGATVSIATITTSGAINLPAIAQTGLYQVLISPPTNATESLNFGLITGTTGSLVPDGPSLALATPFGGVNAYLNFTAASGDNLELALSGVTTSGKNGYLSFSVYSSTGNYVTGTTCFTSSPDMCKVHLWGLAAGAYTITVLPPDAISTIGFTATLTRDVIGSLSQGSPLAVSLSRPGQTERMTFSATAGQTFALTVNGVATVPAGTWAWLYIYSPNGSLLTQSILSGTNGTLNLPNLSAAGTYTVVLEGEDGAPLSATVTLLPGTTGSLVIDGPSQTFSTASGQSAYLSFSASPGDNLELALSGVTGGTYDSASVSVYDANGNSVGSQTCSVSYPAGSCDLALTGLAGGAYTVLISNNGTTGFTVTLTRDIAGQLVIAQPTTLSLSRPGQTARLSFSATSGQTFAITVNGFATAPAGNSGYANVYNPDGTLLKQTLLLSADTTINIPNLVEAGTYTVVVYASYGLPSTASVTLLAGAIGVLTTNGASQALTTAANQNAYLSFTASAGDNLELALSGLTGESGDYAFVTVYDSSGNSIGSVLCYGSSPESCSMPLWGLAGGAYSVVVAGNEITGFNATLTSDLVGSLSVGQPLALNLALPGQTARLSFSAAAGQTLGVAISGMATNPSNNNALVKIYGPSGTLVQQLTQYGYTPNVTINLPNIATAGTYTIIFCGQYGLPTTATITLVAGATGTLIANGSLQNYSTSIGQIAYLNFKAVAGANLELGLSALTGSSSSYASVSVSDANGNSVANVNCFPSFPSSSCFAHLWNLVGGVYTVTVTSNGTTGFGATLTNDVTGVLLNGQATPINLTLPGQTERLTFNGIAGQSGTLTFGAPLTTPSGVGAEWAIYTPSGALLQQSALFGSSTVNLSSLPSSGNYTLIFSGYYGEPVSDTLTLQIQ